MGLDSNPHVSLCAETLGKLLSFSGLRFPCLQGLPMPSSAEGRPVRCWLAVELCRALAVSGGGCSL